MQPNPVRRPDIEAHAVDDELVLYDPLSDHAHALNSTARTVWDLCDGSHDVGDIARILIERFPEASASIPGDVARVLLDLMNRHLLADAAP